MQTTSLIVLLTVIACCVSRYWMTQLIEELKFVLPKPIRLVHALLGFHRPNKLRLVDCQCGSCELPQ